jgi:lipopolysaccharide transport protein LptA
MTSLPRNCLLSLLLLTAWTVRLPAQIPGASAVEAPPPGGGGTVITSDELRADEDTHTAVFSGNVTVVGNNFTMQCTEMTVIFTKDGQVTTITATGNVVIQQPGRTAHCGQARYFREDDRFELTDSPVIVDNKSEISAPKIIIYRTKQSMYTVGRTTTKMSQDIGSGASSANPSNK